MCPVRTPLCFRLLARLKRRSFELVLGAEEAERIKKNNGRVFARKDEPHVQRVWLPDVDFPGLAMARAFGDFELKNYGVISIPQVAYHRLSDRDRFVVLATDGVKGNESSRQKSR